MAGKKKETKKEIFSGIIRFNCDHVLSVDYDAACDEVIIMKQNKDGKIITGSVKLK